MMFGLQAPRRADTAPDRSASPRRDRPDGRRLDRVRRPRI